MSAELLREAAALMRKRAEAVTSGGQWTGTHYWITDYDPSDPSGQTAMQRPIGGMDEPDATHYSSWHPAVALAVAKAMDDVAQAWEICDDGWTRDMDDDSIRFEDTVDGGWLTVARAYLGSPA